MKGSMKNLPTGWANINDKIINTKEIKKNCLIINLFNLRLNKKYKTKKPNE